MASSSMAIARSQWTTRWVSRTPSWTWSRRCAGPRAGRPIARTTLHNAAGAAGIVRSATSLSPEGAATTRSAIIPVMPPQPSPRRIAIGTHPRLPEADALGEEIAAHLRTLGLTANCASLYDTDLRRAGQARSFELFIALGGDGTMLRAGQ